MLTSSPSTSPSSATDPSSSPRVATAACPTTRPSALHRAGDAIHALFSPWRRRQSQPGTTSASCIATIANQSQLGHLRDQITDAPTPSWAGRTFRRPAWPELDCPPLHSPAPSSSPTQTAHLIARRLHQASGLPWVADLRDGWLFEPPNPAVSKGVLACGGGKDGWSVEHVIGQAAAVVTATAPITDDLRSRYPQAAAKITTLTNGYDEAEFASLQRQRPLDGRFFCSPTPAPSWRAAPAPAPMPSSEP